MDEFDYEQSTLINVDSDNHLILVRLYSFYPIDKYWSYSILSDYKTWKLVLQSQKNF